MSKDDVIAVASDVLRHRIVLDRIAKLNQGFSEDKVVHGIIEAAGQ